MLGVAGCTPRCWRDTLVAPPPEPLPPIGPADTEGVKLKFTLGVALELPPVPAMALSRAEEVVVDGVERDWEECEMLAICSWFFRISVFRSVWESVGMCVCVCVCVKLIDMLHCSGHYPGTLFSS